MLILDEPSLGLSQEDLEEIIPVLLRLKKNNTLLVVDHSPIFAQYADHILTFGPSSGRRGGQLVTPTPISPPPLFAQRASYRTRTISLPSKELVIQSPGMNVLTGRSGAGKTQTLYAIQQTVSDSMFSTTKLFTGTLYGSSRSCTATLCGVWSEIRHVLAQTKESKMNGYSHRHFSFNVPGGRCEACKGMGSIRVHIPPLPPQEETCSLCLGNRFGVDILRVRYKGFHAADYLNMDVETAHTIFTHHPKIHAILSTLCQVGLHYLPLGQVSSTLSGGERRRLLMAKLLANRYRDKESIQNALILLDEPSTALHNQDCIYILRLLEELRNNGATVICASNHPWFAERADSRTEISKNPMQVLD